MARWMVLALVVGMVGCSPPPVTGFSLEEPLQTDSDKDDWRVGAYDFESLATYRVHARVLGKKEYSDEMKDLAPMDLALWWGRMADKGIYVPLKVKQSYRWMTYRWGSEGPPIPVKEIIASSSNVHIVPKNAAVLYTLEEVEEGDVVVMEGQLVKITGPNGMRWRSSLKRTDTGNGACELMWVERIWIDPRED